jgi:hypothetical protein
MARWRLSASSEKLNFTVGVATYILNEDISTVNTLQQSASHDVKSNFLSV